MKRSNNSTCERRRRRGGGVVSQNDSIASRTRSSSNSTRCKKKRKKIADLSPFVLTLKGLPISIRVKILNYFDGKQQQELVNLQLVSKGFYKDCKEPGIEWELIPLFLLRPSPNNEDDSGRLKGFIRNIREYQKDDDTIRNFRRYLRMDVEEPHKFAWLMFRAKLTRMTYNIMQLYGIVSLKFSSKTVGYNTYDSLPIALSCMLPNLCKLDISNTNFGRVVVKNYCENCPALEKITNNNNRSRGLTGIHPDGSDMLSATNLREFMMDNSAFHCYTIFRNEMSDLNNHPTIFLLHKCGSMVLERLSMRNSRYGMNQALIPQNTLIKFVRNAPPTLKWFRCDLSTENIDMLRKEQPGIELVN